MLLYEHRKAASAEAAANKYLREAMSMDEIKFGAEALNVAIKNREKQETKLQALDNDGTILYDHNVESHYLSRREREWNIMLREWGNSVVREEKYVDATSKAKGAAAASASSSANEAPSKDDDDDALSISSLSSVSPDAAAPADEGAGSVAKLATG